MVRKVAENGTFYHEPPYTEEEELDLYRRLDHGPFTFLHGKRPPVEHQAQPRKSSQRPREE